MPVPPYTNATPRTVTAVATTDVRKAVSAAWPATASRRSATSANDGSDTSSSATTSVARSRAAAVVTAPVDRREQQDLELTGRQPALGHRQQHDDDRGGEQHELDRQRQVVGDVRAGGRRRRLRRARRTWHASRPAAGAAPRARRAARPATQRRPAPGGAARPGRRRARPGHRPRRAAPARARRSRRSAPALAAAAVTDRLPAAPPTAGVDSVEQDPGQQPEQDGQRRQRQPGDRLDRVDVARPAARCRRPGRPAAPPGAGSTPSAPSRPRRRPAGPGTASGAARRPAGTRRSSRGTRPRTRRGRAARGWRPRPAPAGRPVAARGRTGSAGSADRSVVPCRSLTPPTRKNSRPVMTPCATLAYRAPLIPTGVSVAMPSRTKPMWPTEENATRRLRSRWARQASDP